MPRDIPKAELHSCVFYNKNHQSSVQHVARLTLERGIENQYEANDEMKRYKLPQTTDASRIGDAKKVDAGPTDRASTR